jgi:adenylate kinase
MQRAILLIGPTGSGKTPLGHWLGVHGIAGCHCHHFDFGENLRRVAAHMNPEFTPKETSFIENLVRKGALLEDRAFPLAIRILDSFCRNHGVRPEDLLVMNGLPRHTGQAEALASRVRLLALLELQCSADVVWERLVRNAGGDRISRSDDDFLLVKQKLTIFEQRTAPLVAFYRALEVPILQFRVDVLSTPEEVFLSLGEKLATIVPYTPPEQCGNRPRE